MKGKVKPEKKKSLLRRSGEQFRIARGHLTAMLPRNPPRLLLHILSYFFTALLPAEEWAVVFSLAMMGNEKNALFFPGNRHF